MSEKKTPNRKSWKTEAEELEALLVLACQELMTPETGGTVRDALVAAWWEDYELNREARADELKTRALAKLSAAERAALGVGD